MWKNFEIQACPDNFAPKKKEKGFLSLVLKDIWLERIELDSQEHDERKILLKQHNEKLDSKRNELYKKCESLGGHKWKDMPDNGINHFNYFTNEWPQHCQFCYIRK